MNIRSNYITISSCHVRKYDADEIDDGIKKGIDDKKGRTISFMKLIRGIKIMLSFKKYIFLVFLSRFFFVLLLLLVQTYN